MALRVALFLLIFILLIVSTASSANAQKDTYSETRAWLLKMDRRASSKELRRLFEEADKRMPDLIKALDDPQKEVSVNSQAIIKYLANPKGLSILEEWYQKQYRQNKVVMMPNMKLLSEEKYLEGEGTDLASAL